MHWILSSYIGCRGYDWFVLCLLSNLLLVNFPSHRGWKSRNYYISWILCSLSPWHTLDFITKMQQLKFEDTEMPISCCFFLSLLASSWIHFFHIHECPGVIAGVVLLMWLFPDPWENNYTMTWAIFTRFPVTAVGEYFSSVSIIL